MPIYGSTLQNQNTPPSALLDPVAFSWPGVVPGLPATSREVAQPFLSLWFQASPRIVSALLSDIKVYAAATFPEDDVATAIGGDIDTSKKCDFFDFSDVYQVVSSSAADTTGRHKLTFRDFSGNLLTEYLTLNGQTPVLSSTSIGRILKGQKVAAASDTLTSTLGDIAMERQTPEFTGTLVGLGTSADQVIFPAGASTVDQFYTGMVFRVLTGTGQFLIFEVINYVGASKTATLSRTILPSGGNPLLDGSSNFRVSKGMFFDKTPSEILSVVRMDISSFADPSSGVTRTFFVKLFVKHTNASASGVNLTSGVLGVFADPSGRNTYSHDDAINLTQNNGTGNNRQISPTLVQAFNTAAQNIPGGTLTPGDRIGLWIKLTDAAGAGAINTTWTPSISLQTT